MDLNFGKNETYVYALSCSLAISSIPTMFLFLIRFNNNSRNDALFKMMLSFAAGGMLGDAFLHLIPHSLMEAKGHDHSHHHNHGDGDHHHEHESNDHGHSHDHEMNVGLYVIVGMLFFMVLEILVRMVKDSFDSARFEKLKKKKQIDNKECSLLKSLNSSAILNMIADFMHNFTDGLAIGASFTASKSIGIGSTLMVMLHEFPHQIGDFAVLLESGISRKRAIFLQFLTAFGAPIGTFLALKLDNIHDSTKFILPFTAGGFIYISCVNLIPSIVKCSNKIFYMILNLSSMVAGIGVMILIAKYE